MAFKFKDLIVTRLPGAFSGDASGGSGGSGGTVGSCTSECGPTVGSCTSECGPGGVQVGCGLSDEFLNPLAGLIDPPFMVELRLLVRLAVAKSYAGRVKSLEAKMHPHTLREVDHLEEQLKEALTELEAARQQLQTKGS